MEAGPKAGRRGRTAEGGSRRGGSSSRRGEALQALEGKLGHTFADRRLLTLALTHSSFVYEERLGRARSTGDAPNEPGTDNEQLEFLGDAVLGLAVTELLLRSFPDRTEGEMTRMRSAIVSRKRMAELGQAWALEATLRLGRSVENAEVRQRQAVLANTAEALLGAVYLDVQRATDTSGGDGEAALRTVRAIVERQLVTPELPAIREALAAAPGRGALRDAKSRLQECVQAVAAGRIVYEDTGEEGPAHARRFHVEAFLEGRDGALRRLAQGEGGSKKEAQQAAAEVALAEWTAPERPARSGAAEALASPEHP